MTIVKIFIYICLFRKKRINSIEIMFTLFALSLGGYQDCSIESDYVKFTSDYVKKIVPAFYTEYGDVLLDFTIKSARYQIVNGYNLELTCSVRNDLFTINLYCNPRQHVVTLTSFNSIPNNSVPIPGGWVWTTVDDFLETNREKFSNLLLLSSGGTTFKTIFAVKRQVVNGINFLVTFFDSNDILHTVKYHQNFDETDVTLIDIHQYQ